MLIILAVVLLIFGGAKLPKLARSLGEAQTEFKKATTESPAPAVDAEAVAARRTDV
jgi:sec-independent protein translocase protein TatA